MNNQKLRAAAEKCIADAQVAMVGVTATVQAVQSPEILLHELQVHQFELELQNEELRRAQNELEASRDRFADFYEFSPVGYFTLSDKGLIDSLNLTAAELLGVERNMLLQKRFAYYVMPEDADRWYAYFLDALNRDEKLKCEVAIRRANGFVHVRLDSLRLVKAGQPTTVRVVMTDISDLKWTEAELKSTNELLLASEQRQRDLAQHDMLTGLANRVLLSDRLNQMLVIAQRDQTRFALLYLDLDKFKPVNDMYGHAVGDELLKEVAQRMTRRVRESDTVARIGGDEFTILLRAIDSDLSVITVADSIRDSLIQPFLIQNHLIEISCSIGIAIYPDHGHSEIELSRQADAAMYRAKEAGRDIACLANSDAKTFKHGAGADKNVGHPQMRRSTFLQHVRRWQRGLVHSTAKENITPQS